MVKIGERKKDEKLLPASWSRGGEEWRRGAEFVFFFLIGKEEQS